MQKTAITNAQIVLPNGIIWDGTILITDGKITAFGSSHEFNLDSSYEVIDANGAYVGPGFVDIHVHGCVGFSTSFDVESAANHLLSHGTTSFLATPDYLMNFEEFMSAIRTVKQNFGKVKSLKGLYLEGPFINTSKGAYAHANPWRNGIPKEQYTAFVDEAESLATVWTIAPERDDIMGFLQYARKVNPECKFAVGHSMATPMQIESLGKYRPTIQTHSMNATGRGAVPEGTRGYGPDEYCFKEPDVYCELISDSCGLHVHPQMQQLLLHNKGIHRVILITDCTADVMPPPKQFSHVTDLNFDVKGGLSGSIMRMDMACINIMSSTNCGIAQAFLMASTNPAKAIGMDDKIGSIAISKNADLVFVDDKFNVQKVMLEGEII